MKWARCPVFSLAQPLGKLFSVLLIFVFLIFLYGFLGENLSNSANSALLGLSIIFLTLRVLFWLENAFFEHKLKRPALSATIKDALEKLDFPVVMGSVLITATFFILVNIAADVLYGVVDPRVKMG